MEEEAQNERKNERNNTNFVLLELLSVYTTDLGPLKLPKRSIAISFLDDQSYGPDAKNEVGMRSLRQICANKEYEGLYCGATGIRGCTVGTAKGGWRC